MRAARVLNGYVVAQSGRAVFGREGQIPGLAELDAVPDLGGSWFDSRASPPLETGPRSRQLDVRRRRELLADAARA